MRRTDRPSLTAAQAHALLSAAIEILAGCPEDWPAPRLRALVNAQDRLAAAVAAGEGISIDDTDAPLRILGFSDVAAEWFGVGKNVLHNWISRYSEGHPVPVHDFELGSSKGWHPDRKQDWLDWRDSLDMPGQGAKGRPKPRRNVPD